MLLSEYKGRSFHGTKTRAGDPRIPLSFPVRPVLWLKGASIEQADLTALTWWPGIGGTSIAAIQGISDRQPIYHAGPPPFVRWDGVDDMMLLGHALDKYVIGTSGVKWTTLAVFKTSSATNQDIWSKFYGFYFGGDHENTSARGPHCLLYNQSGSNVYPLLVSDTKDGTHSLNYYGSTNVADGNRKIVVWRFDMTGATDADKIQIYVNGTAETLTAIHADGSGASDNYDSNFCIGQSPFGAAGPAEPDFHNMFAGDLFELMVLPDAISTGHRQALESYATAEYP